MSNGRNLAKVERTDRTVNVSACAACREAFAATGNACSECSQDAEDWARIQEGLLPLLGSRYQLRCRLGSGSVGEVYRANDTMLDRDVAIKRVRLDTFVDVAERERMRERTIREAKTAAKLKHPHIVTIHDIIDTPETSFIVMEFIDGSTLESIIKKKRRLGLDETLNILGPTAQALDRAHENGVVHRDVKPANIMLEGETGVKVTDFGIAKSESATSLTATGSILGTPYYMSPEQARGDGNVDGRSDLFALGCVLFECLTGQRAFRGRSLVAVLMAIANEEPAAVDFESLGIHGDIGAIFKRALAKDLSKRFASAVELIDSVRSLPRIEPRCDEAGEQSKLVAPLPVVTRREMGKKDSFDSRLQGNLKDTSAAELIRDFYGARHTGILHILEDIATKHASLLTANSYELLSVPRDASENEIRQAYYRMAKKYHPDGTLSLTKQVRSSKQLIIRVLSRGSSKMDFPTNSPSTTAYPSRSAIVGGTSSKDTGPSIRIPFWNRFGSWISKGTRSASS